MCLRLPCIGKSGTSIWSSVCCRPESQAPWLARSCFRRCRRMACASFWESLCWCWWLIGSSAIGFRRYAMSPKPGMLNNGGPAFSSYLLLQKLKARPFIATSAIYFALLNLIKVPGFLYTGVLNLPLLFSLWWVFPFIPVGIWVARMMLTRLSPLAFEWIIIVLLIFSSLWLLR